MLLIIWVGVFIGFKHKHEHQSLGINVFYTKAAKVANFGVSRQIKGVKGRMLVTLIIKYT